MAKQAKQVHTLEDLLVEEVSVVDRPANKRRFLAVKNEDGKGQEIQVDADGNLIAGDQGDPSGEQTDATPIDQIFADAGKTLADIQKRLTIDPEMRRDIFQNVGEAVGRLHTVMGACDIAQSDREGQWDSKLIPLLAAELDEVAKAIAVVARKIGKAPAKKDEGGEEDPQKALEALVEGLEAQVQKAGAKMSKARLAAFKAAMDTLAKILAELDPQPEPPVQKAEWTTAQINDFPDSSFLYIKPGGTKDSGGKTVPRTNRMFPVKDGAGKLDGPHVRNAIARIPQSNLPGDLKSSLQDKARKLLESMKGATKTKKAETPAEPSAEVVALQKMVGDLTTTVKKQAKDLRTLRMSRPGSNAIPVEKGAGDGPPPSSVSWPLDMNDEKTPERVDKATSFMES